MSNTSAAIKQETERKTWYARKELIGIAQLGPDGTGVGPQLPDEPLLMFNRVVSIGEHGGKHDSGHVFAELDVGPDSWFFGPHFRGDPVMPGCFQLDALWQLAGFYLAWLGARGKGRAREASNLKLLAEIPPIEGVVRYEVDVERAHARPGKLAIVTADGAVFFDGVKTMEVSKMKVVVMP